MDDPKNLIENLTYEELELGRTAHLVHTLTLNDIQSFALVSGDVNPAHVDPEYAEGTRFHGVIAHGMFAGALISSLLGTEFPGPGTIYLEQSLRFLYPVRVGDTLTVSLKVVHKDDLKSQVRLACEVVNQSGEVAVTGEALVKAPKTKVIRPRASLPSLHLFNPNERLANWVHSLPQAEPLTCAVVHPCDETALNAAVEATHLGLIAPIWVGPEARIRQLAERLGLDLGKGTFVDSPHSHASAQAAAQLAAQKKVALLMKGSLHSRELLEAIQQTPALLTERRLSYVARMEVPTYPRPLLVTDTLINIAPNLEDKADILRNAVALAHMLGIDQPKVAVLSAQEHITEDLISTLDAAALCKMTERHQIGVATVDGPLAFDTALSALAAQRKGIVSPVAGQADVLMAPDLESGHMLARQLEALAGASSCGVVMGARVPIALSSRAQEVVSHLASLALACWVARAHTDDSMGAVG